MKRGKVLLAVAGSLLLILTGLSARSSAGVHVNIGINIPLPALVLPAPPSVVVIPGSYVYYAPDTDVDILFYHGYWYRPYEGGWYRARSYNGRWAYLPSSGVPRALMGLPHDYRGMSHGGRRIAYGQLTRNWKRWERERYWDSPREEDPMGRMGHMGHMGR
ncbi:MAG: hypothetical protein M1497_03545 [Nitrospirae bacterium]|nr:hypothetical protein [Nitrospirota bacterium]